MSATANAQPESSGSSAMRQLRKTATYKVKSKNGWTIERLATTIPTEKLSIVPLGRCAFEPKVPLQTISAARQPTTIAKARGVRWF